MRVGGRMADWGERVPRRREMDVDITSSWRVAGIIGQGRVQRLKGRKGFNLLTGMLVVKPVLDGRLIGLNGALELS